MGEPGDSEHIERQLRARWSLLESVVSPVLSSLPFHGREGQHVKIPRPVALVRSKLEWIGSNLDSQLYFPQLPNLLPDVRQDVYEALDKVLEMLEESVIEGILGFRGEREQQPSDDQEAGLQKFPRLRVLRAVVRSVLIAGVSGRGPGSSPSENYVSVKMDEASLSLLYLRLDSLHKIVSDAFPRILSEAHPTLLEDSIAVAKHAREFGKAAQDLFDTMAVQLNQHCKKEHAGSIRVAVLGKSQVNLLLPLCSKDSLHPASCLLSTPLQPSDNVQPGPRGVDETSICDLVRKSYRRKCKLSLLLEDSRLRECGLDLDRCAPLKKSPLSRIIWDHDKATGETRDARAFTNQSRAETPVLLAHSMLYLYRTRWFQHLWDVDQLFFWMGVKEREGLLHDPYPYLACDLSLDGSKSANESIFSPDEERYDPLYRHSLVLEFGLRMLEIESGKRFDPDPDEDADPEGDEGVALPYLTLHRALAALKGKGEVEDAYYNIAKSCLEFDNNLKKKKFQEIEASLREWVVLHNLIFSPLLQLLANKFRGAAADLLELEQEAQSQKAGPSVVTTRSSSWTPAATGIGERSQNRLPAIPEECYVPMADSAVSVVVTTADRDCADAGIDRSPCLGEREMPAGSEDGTSTATTAISEGVRLFDDDSNTFDQSIRKYAEEFLAKLKAFRKRYIKPSEGVNRIRIAVLDTGIDEEDTFIKARREFLSNARKGADPIIAIKEFIGDSAKDNNGHGTQIAGILTEFAPEADLYIAKISDQMHVKDAINWAKEQGCQIITMSFGMERSAQLQDGFDEISTAIGRAHDAGILMFAAASNCGGNGSRTYPAWDARVVCVHALDGRGSPSGSVNPSVDAYPGDNFGTLGVGVKCRWRNKITYKTGTSFATPVAASLAALLLEYVDQSYALKQVDEVRYRSFRTCHGIQQIFRRFMSIEMGNCGYRFVAPWAVWDPNRFSDEDIWSRLKTEYVPYA